MGRQKAVQAASGLDVNVGTPAAIRSETSRMVQLDALTMRNNAWRQASGMRNQAQQMRMQGKLGMSAAEDQMWASVIQGGADAGATYLGADKVQKAGLSKLFS